MFFCKVISPYYFINLQKNENFNREIARGILIVVVMVKWHHEHHL